MQATVRKPVQVSRSVRLITPFDAEGKGAELQITMQRGKKVETFTYWIDRIASDFGQAFLLEKHGNGTKSNEEYHVMLEADGHSCSCPGGTYKGRCKHQDAVIKLLELGKL